MMKRDACLKALAARVEHTDIVVPAFQAAFEWIVIHPSDLNYLTTGAMGQASSHALGLALAFPDRRVIVLDGDGSLVMNLGTLITIAEQRPANLFHFVCNNGVYEANGSHPVPGAERVDYCGMARAAGVERTSRFDELDDFDARIADVLAGGGPAFIEIVVEQGEAYEQDYTQLHSAERRARFKQAVNQ